MEERQMTDAEIRMAVTAATASGTIALQGLLQLGISMRENGMDASVLVAPARHMLDMARQYEAALDPRLQFLMPQLRRLLDHWAFDEPLRPAG